MPAPWPRGYDWAIVLTCMTSRRPPATTVKSRSASWRAARLPLLVEPVPRRYQTSDDFTGFDARGFEVGVHGLYHTGSRDSSRSSPSQLRLPAIRESADRWGALRFPRTGNAAELGLDACSSSTTTAGTPTRILRAAARRCCAWYPFFNGDLVELPITLRRITPFVILGHADEAGVDREGRLPEGARGNEVVITHPTISIDRHLFSPIALLTIRR